MVDWGAGNYERTAAELEPVARAVVQAAALRRGDHVLDLACGTGNAALLAAACGARVVGVDAAPRLLDVARARARSLGVEVDFREGALLELPVDDGATDVVVSVFGLIFAHDPSRAMHEVARVLRVGGRVYLTAWIPAGPIDAMLTAMGRVLGRVTQAPPPQRFPWSDASSVQAIAREAGLSLQTTTTADLAIRDSSPEAYVAAGQEHPMALAVQPVLAAAGDGADAEARAAMIAVLRDANEDPDRFFVHSPYVVHELHAGRAESSARSTRPPPSRRPRGSPGQ
jgi:SAM-dependent methyltransferase